MKTVTKIICSLMIAVFAMVFMGTSVFAAETGSAWLSVTEPESGVTAVSIVTDEVVTDGLIVLTFDDADLNYSGLEVNSDCLTYHSVNSDTPGTIKLAWVGSGDYEADSTCLVTLIFNGVTKGGISVSGEMTNSAGNTLSIEQSRFAADFQQLRKAVLLARAMDPVNYTAESYAAMTAALEAAESLLADMYALQTDVDAATQALYDAVDALELAASTDVDQELVELNKAYLKAMALDKDLYTEDSFAHVDAALAVVMAYLETPGTAEEMQAAADALNDAIRNLELNPDSPDTGNFLTVPVMLLMVLSACGIVAVAALISKKGRCVK